MGFTGTLIWDVEEGEELMEVAPSCPDPDICLAGRTILLVDDREDFRFVCSYHLTKYGAMIHEAADVEAAQEALLRAPVPDVVLLDNDLGWGGAA